VSVLSGERPASDRSILRFIAFGIAVIIGVGALTTRLAFLQIAQTGQYAQLSDRNRSVLQAIPSSRGLIFDREGRPLVTNVPSFAVKIRPADLAVSRRDVVLTPRPAPDRSSDINTEIDRTPDRDSTWSGSPRTCPRPRRA
jgi:cell division protein FtsI/penicillin-binding protein 2